METPIEASMFGVSNTPYPGKKYCTKTTLVVGGIIGAVTIAALLGTILYQQHKIWHLQHQDDNDQPQPQQL